MALKFMTVVQTRGLKNSLYIIVYASIFQYRTAYFIKGQYRKNKDKQTD